jgi:hypothetical protein
MEGSKTRQPTVTQAAGCEDDGKSHVTIRIEDRDLVAQLTHITELEDSTRKEFVQKTMRLLLLSKEGRQLQEMAEDRERSVISELSSWMQLLQDNVDWHEVGNLAKESQRYPEQMIVYLIRLGLITYKHQIDMHKDIQGNSLIL